jgi:carboxyl-terminal processing protease
MNGAESRWQPRQTPPDEEEKPKSSAEQRRQAQEAADKLAAKWRNSTDIPAALEMLTTTASGDHTLTIERAGQTKPRQVKVTLGPLQVAPVTKRLLPGNIGHLQVRQLSAQTVTEVAAALKELRDAGAQSLILDLRRSPGGSLDAAQQIAGLFLPSGTMGLHQVRDERRKLIDKPLGVKAPAATAPKFTSMAVLVDGGTAGASEVLAAALRDLGAAKLYGSNTFGDGTEQTIMPLDNGAAVSVTSGRFLTSKKVSFDKTGLKPDVVVPAPTGPGLDRQLEQAVKSLRA